MKVLIVSLIISKYEVCLTVHLYYLTNVYLIICQGVADESKLETAESLRKPLHCHRISYKRTKLRHF